MPLPPRWLGPLLVLLVVAWGWISVQPPRVLDREAIGSGQRAVDMLGRILDGVGPHPVGTPPAREVERRLVAELEDLGFEPEVVEHTFCGFECLTVRNVLVVLPGTNPERWVGLSSHYDSVWAGPGAGDDLAGTAAAVEILRSLKTLPHEAGVVALFNEGEEANLYGSQAFITTPWADRLDAIVNLEARGTSGPAYLFELHAPLATVGAAYARYARRPSVSGLYVAIYDMLPNNTDVAVYDGAGIPSANIAFLGHGERYHTPLDDLDHLDPRTVQHQVDQGLAMVRAFASLDDDLTADAPALLFDVGGFFVVCLPWPAAHGLVGLGLLLVGWWARPTLGALAGVAGIGVGLVAASQGIDVLLHAIGGGFGRPWAALGVLWSLALLGVLGARWWVDDEEVLWSVVAVFHALLLGLFAYALPAGVYVFAPGACLAVVPLIEPRLRWVGALAGLPVAVLAVGLPEALGLFGPVVTVPAFLALLPTAPLFHRERWLVAGPVVVLIAGCLVAAGSPVRPVAAIVDTVVTEDQGWRFIQPAGFPRPGEVVIGATPDRPSPIRFAGQVERAPAEGFHPALIRWTDDVVTLRAPGGWAARLVTEGGQVMAVQGTPTTRARPIWLGDTTELTIHVSPSTRRLGVAVARPGAHATRPIHTGHRTWSWQVTQRPAAP